MKLDVFYDDAYAPSDVPSLARLGVAARALQDAGIADLHRPPPFDPRLLRGLHTDAYLDAFEAGLEPLASSQGIRWNARLRDATYAMLAGQLAAARHAWSHGLAMNLARGFHHAVPERGSGFCALNGLALLAHVWPTMKVFVIDCDEHGGNGTEEFAARLPNLYNASMFGTRFGCLGHERSWPYEVRLARDGRRAHLRALAAIEQRLARVAPDLVVYQRGRRQPRKRSEEPQRLQCEGPGRTRSGGVPHGTTGWRAVGVRGRRRISARCRHRSHQPDDGALRIARVHAPPSPLERGADRAALTQHRFLVEPLAIGSDDRAQRHLARGVACVHDHDEPTGLADRRAVVAEPVAARVERRVAARERGREYFGVEALPGRFVDLAAAGDRATEVERVAQQRLLVAAAAERMVAHPVHVAARQRGERTGESEAGECAQVHLRLAWNNLWMRLYSSSHESAWVKPWRSSG